MCLQGIPGAHKKLTRNAEPGLLMCPELCLPYFGFAPHNKELTHPLDTDFLKVSVV
jgi:hypothetical protein